MYGDVMGRKVNGSKASDRRRSEVHRGSDGKESE